MDGTNGDIQLAKVSFNKLDQNKNLEPLPRNDYSMPKKVLSAFFFI